MLCAYVNEKETFSPKEMGNVVNPLENGMLGEELWSTGAVNPDKANNSEYNYRD